VHTRRTAPWLLALTAAGTVLLSGCVYDAEPAPGSPESPNGLVDTGFPPPGPAPVPGRITPQPVAPPAPANEPRPERGPVPTEGPQSSENPPRPTGAPAPAPGS
jgi:hypothetical protein